MVRYRGLASVRGVADRASALVSSPVTEAVAGRLLAAMPRVRWLDGDQRRRWFSLAGDTGRFEIALRKIFAVARAVPFDELGIALGRALAGAYEAPRQAIERCLVDMGRCQIGGDGVVRRVEPDTATALTPQETTLVDLIDAAGGTLDAPALRRGARAGGVAKTTVNQLLRLSPLFVPVASGAPVAASAFRLVGGRPAVI
jgi:hypothetical protein